MAEGHDTLTRMRASSRKSEVATDMAATSVQDTPWKTLNQLANMPQTPSRRALSTGPPSAYRSSHRTPAARTPGVGQRLGSAKQTVMVTPHGRAAQRELNLRRVGLTPGKDRRRSGRQQRETPRDTLRALSRLMAPDSQMIASTPKDSDVFARKHSDRIQDDSEDGSDPELPRFSLPLGDDDGEDDSLLLPPPSSRLENENFTVQSVELGRRAQSERPRDRISRSSFGDIRMSSGFVESTEMGYEELRDAYDTSVLAGNGMQDDMGVFFGDDDAARDDNTQTLRELDQRRFSLETDQIGDIQTANMQEDDTETTFVFNVPEMDTVDSRGVLRSNMHRSTVAQVDNDENEYDQFTKHGSVSYPGKHTQDPGGEISFQTSEFQGSNAVSVSRKTSKGRRKKLSKYGIEYPSLPPSLVKRMATSFSRSAGSSKIKISTGTLDAIIQASDWFFEQIGDDLGTFAMHAGRKTIDESDVNTLLSRQRQTNTTTTPFSLAQKYLPRELFQELRMVSNSKNG